MKEVPKINKKYICFDDGKIRESRRFEVVVTEVTLFKEIDKDTLATWEQEIQDINWLYSSQTDYFIKAMYETDEYIFIRTLDGGWFSMGFYGSRLDIDGSLNKLIT